MSENNITTKPTPEQIEQMRKYTGEGEGNNVKITWIKFNGQSGKLDSGHFLLSKGKDEMGNVQYEDLGEKLNLIVLRVRKQLKSDSKTKLYSEEFDSYDEEIIIRHQDTPKDVYTSGSYKSIKESIVNMKLTNVVYAFLPDRNMMCKIGVNAGSLSNFWNYLNTFNNRDANGLKESSLMYVTEITPNDKRSADGFDYKEMLFKRGEFNSDWDKMLAELQKISFIFERGTPKKKETMMLGGEELPVIQVDGDDDSVDISDIPF